MAQPNVTSIINAIGTIANVLGLVSAYGVKPVGNEELTQGEWLSSVAFERLHGLFRLEFVSKCAAGAAACCSETRVLCVIERLENKQSGCEEKQ